MLVEFRVTNFRCFREEQLLSFVATRDPVLKDSHCIETGHAGAPFLTRSVIMYGPNASGKSHLQFALAVMRNLVLGSNQSPILKNNYSPFLLDADSFGKPTIFEITLLLDGVRHQYGFSYDAERIRGEWLLVYQNAKAQRWFERGWNNESHAEEWAAFSTHFKSERNQKILWKSATSETALFLTTAAQLNSKSLLPIVNWFRTKLMILPASEPINLAPVLSRLQETEYKRTVLNLLRAADINVYDVGVGKKAVQRLRMEWKKDKPGEFVIDEAEIPEPVFSHVREDGVPVPLAFRYESVGTHRLFALAGPLLQMTKEGGLLVIDELDASLHPLLTRFLLECMHDPEFNPTGQLWATTHDDSLLDTEILRRDQIWFVEKDRSQASRIFPLTEFSPRKQEALSKGYLQGRYGALPFVTRFRIKEG